MNKQDFTPENEIAEEVSKIRESAKSYFGDSFGDLESKIAALSQKMEHATSEKERSHALTSFLTCYKDAVTQAESKKRTMNGYKNYETWNAYNWLTATEESYNEARGKTPGELKRMIEDSAPEMPQAGLFTDLLQYALEQIDYNELADAINE